MEYKEIIHYISLLLIPLSIAEIYVRQRGLGVKEKQMRDGRIVSNRRSVTPPIGLLIVSIVVAVLTMSK